jgi:hypothetical protein
MNFNTKSFKHCLGSLALISACALSPHTFAGDETYICKFTMSTDLANPQYIKMPIQASSAEDAESKLKAKYAKSDAQVTKVDSCALMGQ